MQHNHAPHCTSCHSGASRHSPPNHLSTVTFTVRHRGEFRRLCTACVLKYHPGHFCPICFQVYDGDTPLPATHHRQMCTSCPTIAHSSCVVPEVTCRSPPYRCPSCQNPNLSFFNWETESIDDNLARQFLAAAKIAMISMRRAAQEARKVAERRAQEAMKAKKIAIEAVKQFFVH